MVLTLVPARRPTRILLTLVAWTVGFLILGFVLMTWSRQSGVYLQAGFLGSPGQFTLFPFAYTIFGYVLDFSVGIFVAIPYLKGIKWKIWQSTLLAVVGISGILYLLNIIDVHQGDLSSERLTVYVIALFAGVLIFALTCEDAPLSRFLSWKSFVYLGRISFALYLIQKTVLVDFMRGWDLVPFYIGANVLCALLYQFVEEPGRKAVMNFKFRRIQQLKINNTQEIKTL